MTGKKGKDELGAVLGNLRKGRGTEGNAPVTVAEPIQEVISNQKMRETREAFTSRLRPSQRRWLKRWVNNLEEEVGGRVTVEDVLEVLLLEVQEDENLQVRLSQHLVKRK